MKILRIYNNNVVLAEDPAGEQAVMIGRGLAFGMKKGQELDPQKVEQTFRPEANEVDERLAALLAEMPAAVLALATELEEMARTELRAPLSHSFVVPVADHINFALQRAREGLRIEYPLSIEVGQLYPQEMAFGRRAVELVNQRFDASLPEEEAAPLALHLVNAQFASEDLSRAFAMTEIFAEIFQIISQVYGHPVERSRMSVARFVTHLRYLFVRAEQGKDSRGGDHTLPAIHDAVRTGYPRAYNCAHKVLLILESHLGQDLGEDELTYLTIHIARLAQDLWGEESGTPAATATETFKDA